MRKSWRLVLAGLWVGIALASSGGALAASPQLQPGPPPPSVNSGMGIDGMVLPPDIRNGNQPMLFEKYAALDYTPLNVDPGSAVLGVLQNNTLASANLLANFAASVLAAFLLSAGSMVIRLVEWTFSLDLVTAAGGPVAQVVDALHHQFYDRLQGAVLVGLGLALTYFVLVGRLLRAMVAIIWAALALALGAALMAAPVEYVGSANEFSNQASQWALEAVSSVDTQHDATNSQGPPASAELRTFANRVWVLWVYDPWTELEFGKVDPKVPGSDRQLGVELLEQHAGHASSFDSDFQAMPQPVKDWYNGDNGIQRASDAFFALAILAAAGILLLGLTFTVFMTSLALVVLAMTMPFFLLAAPVPGYGQRMFTKWLELLLGALVLKVMLSLLLGVVMILAGVIAGFAANLGWGLTAMLQLVLLWLAWQHRKTFVAMGRQAAHPRLKAGVQHAQHSQPAQAADRQLIRARRRAVAPLRSSQGSRRQLAQAGAKNGAQAAVKGSSGTAARVAAGTAGAGLATAGLALAGVVAVNAARGGVHGYRHLRHQTHVAGTHFVGGNVSRPTTRQQSHEPGFGSLAWGQFRARRSQKRLPPLRQRQKEPLHAGPDESTWRKLT